MTVEEMKSNKPLLRAEINTWSQVLRNIASARNERTLISNNLPTASVGNSASIINFTEYPTVASALILANLNSIPLDWATRYSVGGNNLNYFIVKQLPVLPPEAHLDFSPQGQPWVQLIIPRALELTYTSYALTDFARALGFAGEPFLWDDGRRHCLQSELDAIFVHMYGLSRSDLKHILDAPEPSQSFPTLKKNENKEFGEYRTMRYVLEAYDLIAQGKLPDIADKKETHSSQPVE